MVGVFKSSSILEYWIIEREDEMESALCSKDIQRRVYETFVASFNSKTCVKWALLVVGLIELPPNCLENV